MSVRGQTFMGPLDTAQWFGQAALPGTAPQLIDPPPRTVYLCGPITGLGYSAAREGWRVAFSKMLLPHIHPLSPMRGKDFLEGQTILKEAVDGTHNLDEPMAIPRGIVGRDAFDLRTADVVVACFLGAERPTLGSIWELGGAHMLDKPVVLVMEGDDGANPNQHIMVTESADWWVEDLETAAKVVNQMLTPGV